MARLKFAKLSEYELKISGLEKATIEIGKKAVYEGANIVANEVKERLQNLATTTDALAMVSYANKKPTYLTKRAKDGLVESFGITPIEIDDKGVINAKLGFDGYNSVVTKKYPKGQPNVLIARSCESGSVAIKKQPFMRKAVNASKPKAEAKMIEIVEQELKKRMR